jgi:hypothetical protein
MILIATSDAGMIVQWLTGFFPLSQISSVIDSCTPAFQLIGVLILVLGAIQEIPKHQVDGIFAVIARSTVLCAMIAYAPSWMYFGELFAQGLTDSICTSAAQTIGGNSSSMVKSFTTTGSAQGSSLANTPIMTKTVPASTGQDGVLYDYNDLFTALGSVVGSASETIDASSSSPGGLLSRFINDAKHWTNIGSLLGVNDGSGGNNGTLGNMLQNWLDQNTPLGWSPGQVLSFCIALFGAICVFILEALLLIQKAIIIFSRLLMPVFLSLLSWQGPTRFLGVNYIQSVIAVMSWPIGWSIVYIGAVVGLANTATANAAGWTTVVSIFVNVFLICLWMITGATIAPMLMTRVVTAGGNFASGMIGAVAGRAFGMAGSVAGAAAGVAGAGAGAAVGGSVGGPAGAMVGAAIGSSVAGGIGRAVTSQAVGGLQSAISQATGGDGGGGAVPTRASTYAGMAALQGIAQMGQQPPPPTS